MSLADNDDHIQKYAEQYREFHAVTSQGLGDPYNRTVITAGRPIEELHANEVSLVKLLNSAKSDMVELGNKGQDLNRLEEQLRSFREEDAQLGKRIEVLRAEGALGGRLSVVGTPEIPISPETDPRVKIAPAGALAGLCMPASLMVLLSLARRRYRYSDDAQSSGSLSAPLLGILPELNLANSDAKQALAAAHSIHQIRVSLRAEEKQSGSHVYLVTSAAAGEGKTSLTMSLGLSFAASQLRTLIIDGDFVGQHLSDNLKARELEGLSEALTAGTLHKLVRKTQGGLCVLTAGRTSGAAACSMRTDSIHSVLTEARRYFDVILVDSGPILGSLEAAVLAPEVDGVIFTISRGQQRSTVESATRRIRSLGGRVVGYVFNRAKPQDFDSSPYASSSRLSSPSDDGDASSVLTDLETIATPFGPLVRAVAAGVPAMQN
jgi:capsular exopolysaccharide synthesis family protein